MAYIPGLKHDLFLSYAHEDKRWVSALQEQLTERLIVRLGESDVWQDENNIRTGQDWPAELEKAIRGSAAFLAVLSRSSFGSQYCEKELRAFIQEAEKAEGLETGGYGRVLKVIKFPWVMNSHENYFGTYQHVPFFDRDAKTGQETEFRHTSAAFHKAVDKLSSHIEELFKAMLRGRQNVFVARAVEDAAEERESVIREIKAAGYALSPPPRGSLPMGLNRKALLQFMEETRVTVHLLGAGFEREIRDQIDLAIEAEKKVVFYLVRGHESAGVEQRKLIEEIRENKWGLKEGTWALLESRSSANLRRDLIDLLAPPRASRATGQNDGARVYLLCDPTTPEDAGFAREVQSSIREKEKMRVELQQTAGDSFSPGEQHERLLNECDGLLLYYEKAPPRWLKRTFGDLLTAEDRAGRRELKSKAMLVGGSNMAMPGLTVIQRRDPFDLQQLEPFLAPLRSGAGDLAHAGG